MKIDLDILARIQHHLLAIEQAAPVSKSTSANPHAFRAFTLADAKSNAAQAQIALQQLMKELEK